MRGAIEGGNEVEKVFLRDKNIHPCLGCSVCSYEKKPCPQKDDAAEVIQKMLEADVIVMGTPVYFYAMSAQMKTLIDRSSPYYERMSGKTFGFIMTSADDDPACMDRTLADFRGYLACLEDPHECFTLRAAGLTHPDEAKASPYLQQARDLGRAL